MIIANKIQLLACQNQSVKTVFGAFCLAGFFSAHDYLGRKMLFSVFMVSSDLAWRRLFYW